MAHESSFGPLACPGRHEYPIGARPGCRFGPTWHVPGLRENRFTHSSWSRKSPMIKEALTEAEERMKGAITALGNDLAAVRTGRASPALVERLDVQYYGSPTPLQQLATISAPEPRLLTIKPFDPASLKDIERAILASELGLTPNNDGKLIRLSIPALTEERRKQLTKVVHHRLEEARVAVRNVRRSAHEDLREFEKEKMISQDDLERGETELQKLTDKYVEKIEELGKRKETEIMEI